jgi:regulator of protease activity HflC (stomatin/prohibitin superfamily)
MHEIELRLPSGWPWLVGVLSALVAVVLLYILAGVLNSVWLALLATLIILAVPIVARGFIVNSPNQARVVQLFGRYVGTIKEVGFFYGNPLYSRTRVTLRVNTFETGTTRPLEVRNPATGQVVEVKPGSRRPSKVNDRDGTPIEVAAVVVWRVVNAAEAVFQVDDYQDYVAVQSDAALRNLVSRYPYDGHGEERSLRANSAEIGAQLQQELQARMSQAGVEVIDARLSYLAYAPEIAAAMLQRQQAGAYIAARQLIVQAAVGMVEDALDHLAQKQVVELDAERRAAMVSNLMVVLCGHVSPQPILNTGTIYQ